MLEQAVKIVFHLGVGLVLLGSLAWWVSYSYAEIRDQGGLVIAPFRIAESGDAKDTSRGEALARMLQGRLQQLDRELRDAQGALIGEGLPLRPPSSAPSSNPSAGPAETGFVPPLFNTPAALLPTRLLDTTQLKVAVGGVDVGIILPWVRRWLSASRTLEFTYYQKSKVVVVSGSLHPMGLPNEALRLEIPFEPGEAADLDEVASTTAAEILRRRLAVDPNNRVEALTAPEFGTLLAVLRKV